MKKILLKILFLLLPITAFPQWVQLGQTLEGMYYNHHSINNSADEFGSSVALSSDGTVMAVGAKGNPCTQCDAISYAQVYRLVSGEWVQIGDDIVSPPRVVDQIPTHVWKVALSADGNILAISEIYHQFVYEDLLWQGGRVRLFKNVNDEWVQIGNDIFEENNMNFGYEISLSADGNIIAIYSPSTFSGGMVKVFQNVSDDWVQMGSTFTGTNNYDYFGAGISLSADGHTLAIGAPGSEWLENYRREVLLYQYADNEWGLTTTIHEPDLEEFGRSVSLSADGTKLAAGAPLANNNGWNADGRVLIYEHTGNTWQQIGAIDGTGHFGMKISLSKDGSTVAASNSTVYGGDSGIWVFRHIGNDWIQSGGLFPLTPWQNSLALSADGSILAAGEQNWDGLHPVLGVLAQWNGRVIVYENCELSAISVSAETVSPVCEGTSVTLSATAGPEYYTDNAIINWYESAEATEPVFTGAEFIISEPGETTSYWVEAISPTGCPSERVEVIVPVTPSPQLSVETTGFEICEGNTITIQTGSDSTVHWYDSAESTTPVFTGLVYTTAELYQDTSYWVEAVNTDGCHSEKIQVTIQVTPYALIVTDFSYGESSVCITNSTNSFLLPDPADSFTQGGLFTAAPFGLSIDEVTGEIDVINSEPGTYTVVYSITGDETVCINSQSSEFTIILSSCQTQKGISPNGDGLNDWFDLTGMGVRRLSIYNRYGREVYAQSNYVKEWGGQDNSGNELPDGTYYYAIQKNDGEQLTGWIYINRNY